MRFLNRLCGLAAGAAALCAASLFGERARAEGRYTIEHRNAAGDLLYSETFPNLVVTGGKNLLLDSFLSGSSYTAALYLGLVDGASAPTFAAADTMASHAGWAENSGYSNAARPTATFNAATAGAKGSTAIVFNINAAGTIAGCFLATVSTKGARRAPCSPPAPFPPATACCSPATRCPSPTPCPFDGRLQRKRRIQTMVKGDKARVRPVIVEGEVMRVRYDEDTGARLVHLGWSGPDGEAHERVFAEADLDLIEPAPVSA